MPTYLFAGGGTGGHLYPALAIAERLIELAPDSRAVFACSTRPLDATILGAERLAGEPAAFEAIPAHPFGIRPRVLWRFVTTWGRAVRAGRDMIRAREPACVVAMGGFVAAPVAQAAVAQRRRLALVNLDAVPGRANRWIARRAGRIFTGPDAGPASWERVGPIVRRAAMAPAPREECRRRLGLDPSRPTLLVTGASQGARSINQAMSLLTRGRPALFAEGRWQVIHQTGPGEVDAAREAYASAAIPALVAEFLSPMGVAWGAADAGVGRAGAGIVAEAWANGVPMVFMPYPHHRDQHQRANALPLVRAGAAELIEDLADPERTAPALGDALVRVMDPARRAGMVDALRSLGPVRGAERVAAGLLAMV